jgi:hypothetical protein
VQRPSSCRQPFRSQVQRIGCLVAFLVGVICGRAHNGLSYCWGDMPGPAFPIIPVAGVLVSLPVFDWIMAHL